MIEDSSTRWAFYMYNLFEAGYRGRASSQRSGCYFFVEQGIHIPFTLKV